MKPTFFIIAGETSGDKHAADLVKMLKRHFPDAQFTGIGGDRLQQAGVKLLYHISQLAFLGFTEIIRHLPFIREVFRKVKAALAEGADALILVDYPGFNLRVARIAKKMNIPVVYYICPQLWAWGEKRVEKIRQYVDLPLVIFRFEEEFYQRYGINAFFVGHPLVDQLQESVDENKFREKYHLPADKPLVGLFPGSRKMEVEKLLPVMVETTQLLRERLDCQPVVGGAPHLPESLYRQALSPATDIPLINSHIHGLMKHSHVAMVASGTATLELGYLETPMTVLYAVSPLTYWLGKKLIQIDTIALANIVLGERVVPEFIQHEMKPEVILPALIRYFTDREYYLGVMERLSRIKKELGEPGASERAAQRIAHFLEKGK